MSALRDHGYNISGQTEDGPPIKNGVLNVVAILEQTPWHTTRLVACFLLQSEGNTMMLNAKLIWAGFGGFRQRWGAGNIWRNDNSRWLD